MTYLWSHSPFVSSPPKKRLKHLLHEGKKQEIDEIAIFELENGKFLFVRFYGTKLNLDWGFTDVEEFDNLEEAVKIYDDLLGNNEEQEEEKESE